MQAYAGHKRANVPVTQARRKRKTQTQTEGSNRSPAHDLGAQPASPVCEPSAWARAAAPQLESRGAAEPRLRARCGCLRARGSSKARLSVRVSVRNTTQFVGGWRGGGGNRRVSAAARASAGANLKTHRAGPAAAGISESACQSSQEDVLPRLQPGCSRDIRVGPGGPLLAAPVRRSGLSRARISGAAKGKDPDLCVSRAIQCPARCQRRVPCVSRPTAAAPRQRLHPPPGPPAVTTGRGPPR